MGCIPAARRRNAFTLIELLVVIAIIAVLMSILLPTLSGARRTAQATVGVANMRSLSQVMFAYTNDQGGLFLQPFRSSWAAGGAGGTPAWSDLVDPGEQALRWDLSSADPRFHTEVFAYYWYSYLNKWYGGGRLTPEMFSPADPNLSLLKNTLGSTQETREGWMLWPSSFLYSPTFWCSPSRYEGYDRLPMEDGLLAACDVGSVVNPAGKVLLWERMDFRQTKRPDAPAPSSPGLPPAWNNPRARIHAATCDGSVTEVRIAELIIRVNEGTADGEAIRPLGFLRALDGPPLKARWGYEDRYAVGGEGTLDGDYPLFFWATRGGVRGRDIPR